MLSLFEFSIKTVGFCGRFQKMSIYFLMDTASFSSFGQIESSGNFREL